MEQTHIEVLDEKNLSDLIEKEPSDGDEEVVSPQIVDIQRVPSGDVRGIVHCVQARGSTVKSTRLIRADDFGYLDEPGGFCGTTQVSSHLKEMRMNSLSIRAPHPKEIRLATAGEKCKSYESHHRDQRSNSRSRKAIASSRRTSSGTERYSTRSDHRDPRFVHPGKGVTPAC